MQWRFWRRPLTDAKIAKLASLAANPFAQPEVRVQKMERLLEDGSEAALRGVLQRFAANAQGQIADEEEKQWLITALVNKGEAAVTPLEDYIRGEAKLTFALAAYAKVVGDARAAGFFAAQLRRLGPDDHRSIEAKQQLLAAWVERVPAADILAELAPFLQDHSDDVRWQVLETIEQAAQADRSPDASALRPEAPPVDKSKSGHRQAGLLAVRPMLVALVSEGPASARIARRAARLMCAHKWAWLAGDTKLAPSVAAGHSISAEGRLQAR